MHYLCLDMSETPHFTCLTVRSSETCQNTLVHVHQHTLQLYVILENSNS